MPEPELVEPIEVVCRASLAGLRFGQLAIVDRADPATRRLIRGGYLVPTGVELAERRE